MIERWVESDRGRTRYWISRVQGAPVLAFLHGLGADHTQFDRQVEYFREKYTVLAWDAPGHGASRPYAEISFLHGAVELKRILDREQIGRCVLIGHGLGGMLAQVFIAHWPERVRGFIGVGTSPTEGRFFAPAELRRMGWAAKLCGLLPFKTLHFLIAHRSARSVYGRANVRVALENFDRRALVALIRDHLGALAKELDAGLPACPTLLLVGEKDRLGKTRARCAAWRERSHVPLYRVRAAGHSAAADNPRSANRLMHAFINSLPVEIRAEAR